MSYGTFPQAHLYVSVDFNRENPNLKLKVGKKEEKNVNPHRSDKGLQGTVVNQTFHAQRKY